MINDDSVGGDDLERGRSGRRSGNWMKTRRRGTSASAWRRRGVGQRKSWEDTPERRLEGRSEREEKRGGERERLRERKAKAHAPTLVYQGRMSSLRKHARQSHRRPHASE